MVAAWVQDIVALDLLHFAPYRRGRGAGRFDGAGARRVHLDGGGLDFGLGCQQHGAVNGILQLAHIAAPRIGGEPCQGARTQPAIGDTIGLGIAAREMLGQRRHIGLPLTQRRQPQRDDVEPEIQILAKLPARDFAEQIAVRGGKDADVDAHRGGAAQPVDLALLHCAQQFRLQTHIHFADFVEQQGATLGRFELADAPGDGPAEGPLLMAEQFTLKQILRDRGTVQRHERAA
jgi:hypothetical protein